MKLSNISFKHKGYLWLAGACAACLLLGWLFYQLVLTPQINSKEQLDNRVQLESARVAEVERFILAHPDYLQYLADLDAELVRVDTLLPDKANMGEAVAFLEDTSKATGVVFGSFATEQSVYKNGWTETGVVFKILGNFNDLLEFAYRLDDGPRFMAVRAVEFNHRIMQGQLVGDNATIQTMLERELTNQFGVLVRPVLDRGLLTKPSVMVMDVHLVVVTQGRLPGAEGR